MDNSPSEFDPIELLQWDVSFALQKLNERVRFKRYKFFKICSDRIFFDLEAFVKYIRTQPHPNKADMEDILNKANMIIDLHNTVLADLQSKLGAELSIENDCEFIIINGKFTSTISYEKASSSQQLFQFYTSDDFARNCALIHNQITHYYKKLRRRYYYDGIVNSLYLNDLVIDGRKYTDPYEFIEVKHKKAKHKGIEFYENILAEYNRHRKAKTVFKAGNYFYDESIEFVNYCNSKIADIGLKAVFKNSNILKKADYANGNNSVKSNNSDPKFKTEIVDNIFNILKDFFSQEHQIELNNILVSGGHASQKLIFLDTGNRLADTFKQLYDAGFIIACQKKELEKWISDNFSFRYRGEIKEYKAKYLNDIISTTKDMCQNPIINVKSSIISKVN